MTHPGAPRDVNLDDWLDGIGFHPADTVAKQVGHQAAREYIANLGAVLHELLPAGRDKSIAFTLLEDVLMRTNRALALGGGPAVQSDEYIQLLRNQLDASPIGLSRDHRYEAEQRGEELEPLAGWRTSADLEDVAIHVRPGAVLLFGNNGPFEEPESVEEVAAALLTARNEAWPA